MAGRPGSMGGPSRHMENNGSGLMRAALRRAIALLHIRSGSPGAGMCAGVTGWGCSGNHLRSIMTGRD